MSGSTNMPFVRFILLISVGVAMSRTKILQEIRVMRFEEVYKLRTEGKLTVSEAAKMLGAHERTFRRWTKRYEASGAEGLADSRLGKLAHNAAPVDEVLEMLTLYETRYANFSVSHFFDKYRLSHEGTRSYNWVKHQLQTHGHVTKAKKRGAHRKRREREAMKGMMLHQDGSTHNWISASSWDLIVTLDDADSEIYSAFFVNEEGTWSSFKGVKDVIAQHGLFCSLYTDRGSHYFYTPSAGEKVSSTIDTQFGRAMKQLGIELIAAYSPEARGRSERMFGTLQGRLPQELKLEGITEMEKANQFLAETFLPQFNERFMATPQETELTAFVPLANTNIDEILCLQDSRTVNKDNTVSYHSKQLQIPKNGHRWSYHKTKVTVHEYEDGGLSLFHGPRCIGRYDNQGVLLDNIEGLQNDG